MHRALRWNFLLVLLVTSLAGCGDNGPTSFEDCGNGVLDAGEECDDGPGLAHSNDADGCLSTCKLARCGDGFVNQGVEDCDLNNLGICSSEGMCTCKSLDRDEGQLRCFADCSFDISGCGPPLPTRTVTPTASATPTITSTPTPLSGECGNSTIDGDETCDDGNRSDNDECPSDCRILPCAATSTRVATTAVLSYPGATLPRSLTVLLSYPDGTVDLPDGGERARITARGGAALTLEADFQHALRVRLNRIQGLQAGDIFSVSFDACEGAPPPAASAFQCTVLGCDNVAECSCSVVLR